MKCFWFSVLLTLLATETGRGQLVGDLRLVDVIGSGNTLRKGRVEIYYNRQWGTICDDDFGQTEADVVCRQLGYTSASAFGNDLGYPRGEFPQPIWLNDLNCPASAVNVLNDCTYNTTFDNCSHAEDVMVYCIGPPPDGNFGQLRLVQGNVTSSSFTEGRLEIFINGEWGTICYNRFRRNEADVACRQLGYGGAIAFGINLDFGAGSLLMYDVDCSPTETRIIDCSFIGSEDENCFPFEDAVIRCIGTASPITPTTDDNFFNFGDLRLVQGSVTSSSFEAGRLEIFIFGAWGTICDDGFGQTEADVACRQLGYSSASQYGNNLGFGQAPLLQLIWLDNVVCSSFNIRIIDCFHSADGSHDCTHNDDVMINCGRSFNPTIAPTSIEIPADSSSSITGVIVGSVVGAISLIIIIAVAVVIACVCCGVCAASSSIRSRRTAAAASMAYKANTATVTTSTTTQAQQPPPQATAENYYASQPVQGYGTGPSTNLQAQLESAA